VAHKYGVSVSDITTWNLVGKKGLKPGRKLVIYKTEKPIVPKDSALANKKNESTQQTTDKNQLAENTSSNAPTGITNETTYTVKPGDYFYKIAREHNITVADLLQLNGLNKNAILSAGQVLKLK